MLRTRMLAAATAAVLMLGMTVGGAGAAFASDAPPVDIVVDPAAGRSGPPPHPENGANKITVCHATPADTAANGWNLITPDDDAVGSNQSGHADQHDADIIPAFTYWHKVGNGANATWEQRTFPGKNLTTDFGGVTGQQILDNRCVKPSTPPPPVIVAPAAAVQQYACENSVLLVGGTIIVDLTRNGVRYAITSTSNEDVSFDQSGRTGQLAPGTYTVVGSDASAADGYTATPYSQQFEIEGPIPDCDLTVLPAIDAAASAVLPTCEKPTGSYFFTEDPVFAGKLEWRVNGEVIETLPSGPIAAPTSGKIVVTAQVKHEFLGEYGINPSGEPAVDQETGVYTWTFDFEPPGDECATLIPVVDPFEAVDSCLFGQNYTLFYVKGITYWVTVDPAGDEGPKAPAAVVFAPNASEATFTPQPGDSVSVTPVADPGYVLAENQPTPFSHTFAVYGPDDCQLPDYPNWPAAVTATDEVCTPLGMTGGTITVQFSVGPVDNPNPVRYYLAYGTAKQQELTSVTTIVPSGDHVVTAVVSNPADSVANSGQTAQFPVTVKTADTSNCALPTLAFTGTGSFTTWLPALAALLTVVGMGFVLRRHRIEV